MLRLPIVPASEILSIATQADKAKKDCIFALTTLFKITGSNPISFAPSKSSPLFRGRKVLVLNEDSLVLEKYANDAETKFRLKHNLRYVDLKTLAYMQAILEKEIYSSIEVEDEIPAECNG